MEVDDKPPIGTSNLSSSPTVYVHIRFNQSESNEKRNYHIFADGTQLYVPNLQKRLELDKWYRFDHIHSPTASNQVVYSGSAYNLVENALNGSNTSLFAYGNSRSGKEEIMMAEDGMIAHLVSHLFDRLSRDTTKCTKVSMSYVKIHNEHIYDLLNPENSPDISVGKDTARSALVDRITWYPCDSPHDVYKFIDLGQQTMQDSELEMDRLSSASHTVCQLTIVNNNSAAEDPPKLSDKDEVKTPDARKQSIVPEIIVQEICVDKQGEIKEELPERPRMGTRHSLGVITPVSFQVKTISNSKSLDVINTRGELVIPVDETLDDELRVHRRRQSLQHEALPSYNERLINTRRLLNLSPAEKRRAFQSQIGHHPAVCESVEFAIPENEELVVESKSDDGDVMLSAEKPALNNTTCTQLAMACGDELTRYEATLNKKDGAESNQSSSSVIGKISIIDLAASERLQESYSGKARLKEAQNINLSLLELGNVIAAVASGNNKKHVPYRNSVLTQMLGDSLEGNSIATFLVCCSGSGEEKEMGETKSALEFGQKLKKNLDTLMQARDTDYQKMCKDMALQIEEVGKGGQIECEAYQERVAMCEKEQRESSKNILLRQAAITSIELELQTKLLQCEEAREKAKALEKTIALKENILAMKDKEHSQLQNDINSTRERLDDATGMLEIRHAHSNKGEKITSDKSTGTDVIVSNIVTPTDEQESETLRSTPTKSVRFDMSRDAATNTTWNETLETRDKGTTTPLIEWLDDDVDNAVGGVDENLASTIDESSFTYSVLAEVESLKTSLATQGNGIPDKSVSTTAESDIVTMRSAIIVELLWLHELHKNRESTKELPWDYDQEKIVSGLSSIFSDIFDVVRKVSNGTGEEVDDAVNNCDENIDNVESHLDDSVSFETKTVDSERKLVTLERYLKKRKNSNDAEKMKLALKLLDHNDDAEGTKGHAEEQLYEELIEDLSKGTSSSIQDAQSLHKVLELLRYDRTLVTCLLTLKNLRQRRRNKVANKNVDKVMCSPRPDSILGKKGIIQDDAAVGYKGPSVSYKLVYRTSADRDASSSRRRDVSPRHVRNQQQR